MNYILIEVKKENQEEIFKSLYDGSAMTVTGLLMEELQLYLEHFKKTCGLIENCTIYHFTGETYNNYFNLSGKNKYNNELNFISIPLKYLKNCMGARNMIRWFDDIVNNDLSREEREF